MIEGRDYPSLCGTPEYTALTDSWFLTRRIARSPAVRASGARRGETVSILALAMDVVYGVDSPPSDQNEQEITKTPRPFSPDPVLARCATRRLVRIEKENRDHLTT